MCKRIKSPLVLLNIKKLMHKETTIFIQTSQADMCKNIEFDTIYHEHYSYISLSFLIVSKVLIKALCLMNKSGFRHNI